ncbi:oligosaccharide flippase family protein [Sporosarcina sp. P1]|uniref:oligosaccharide flippase family protein n=1 Tax=Sporosarcina sp. P1 TaxID=2048257 RepID=UPI000C165226|nr:oligosaccharide flippase family protein [Sporosarcina sp. P1]PIC83080.1 hypothetical protein CSV73_08835 [Sporosarcina sp. P1]
MNLIRNISWVFGANLFVSLTKWLSVVVIAKTLNAGDVGVYALAFAIGAPVTLLANMKLRSLYITDDEKGFSNYIFSRNLISIITVICLAIIAIVMYQEYLIIIMLIGLMKVFDLQSDIYYAIPHKNEDMKLIGRLMIIKHLLTFIFFLLAILFTKSLVISISIQLITQMLILYFVEIREINKRYTLQSDKIKFDFKYVKLVILAGLPLGFVQMMTSFNTSYPQYLIEHFESPEILGYFSAIVYIVVIGNMLINAVSQNFLPVLSKKINSKDYDSFKEIIFVKLTGFSLVIGVFLILSSYFFGETFLRIFYGMEYANYNHILILMSFALAINFISWNYDTALLTMKYISIQPKISIVILIMNLMLGYFFISSYGIEGAAITVIITNTLQLILRIVFVCIRLNMLMKDRF